MTRAGAALVRTITSYRLSRARMVTEGAYGQLKGRWRVLLRKCESARDQVRTITFNSSQCVHRQRGRYIEKA